MGACAYFAVHRLRPDRYVHAIARSRGRADESIDSAEAGYGLPVLRSDVIVLRRTLQLVSPSVEVLRQFGKRQPDIVVGRNTCEFPTLPGVLPTFLRRCHGTYTLSYNSRSRQSFREL